MGSRPSKNLAEKPSEPEKDDPRRHPKSDFDVVFHIPDLDKEERCVGSGWRPLFRVRILDDSEPGVDMYEGVRPLISLETAGRWPEGIGSICFDRSAQETNPTKIIFRPALKIKLTEEGRKVKEAERSTSTLCTWYIITAPSMEEKESKVVKFFDARGRPTPTTQCIEKNWPTAAQCLLSRPSRELNNQARHYCHR